MIKYQIRPQESPNIQKEKEVIEEKEEIGGICGK